PLRPGVPCLAVDGFSEGDLGKPGPGGTLFQVDHGGQARGRVARFPPGAARRRQGLVTAGGGTEYFLSSFAVFTGLDNRLALWSLSNTQALNSGSAPTLSNAIVTVEQYANGPLARQPGSQTNDQTKDWPLGQCIENANCNLFLNGLPFGVPETIGRINGNDSRVHQVTYANGKPWTALNTGIASTTDP